MALPQAPEPIINLPTPPAKKAGDYLKAYDSWTYIGIGAIAREVSSIKLHLFKRLLRRDEPATKEIFQHEALSLLYHVNDFYTFYDLVEGTQIYLDLVGEAFWAILRSGSAPAELWLMRPDWVSVVPDRREFIRGYKYYPGGVRLGDKGGVFFEREDVVPFKYFNPLNPYRGYGSVQAAAMAIDTDKFSAEWNRNFFFNSAMPGTILSTEAKLSEAKLKRFVSAWRREFMGRQNAHKIAVLHGGKWKVDTTTPTMREMEFKEQRRVMRDDILATFNVPKTVIGLTEDVNRANAEATTRAFVERAIVPRMRKFVMCLNEFYLRNWDKSGSLFFDFDDPTPEDVETKLMVYKSALGGDGVPWMTINEVRQRENLEPLEGGDDLYLPFNLMPVGGKRDVGQPQQQAAIRLKGKRLPKPKRKFMMPIPPLKLQELRMRQAKKKIKHDLAKLVSKIMEHKNNREEKWEQFWKQMIVKTDVLEQVMIEKLWRLFGQQEDFVKSNLDLIKSLRKVTRKARDIEDLLFSTDDEAEAWRREFLPFIEGILKDKGREILDYLGISGELDLSTQQSIDYIRTDGLKFVKDVNETTREKLRKTLSVGIAEEEGIDALRRRVEEVFDQARGVRAVKIARTEVLRATNFATAEAYRQSGVVKKKIWYTAVDERVCPICAPLHGKEVGVNERFKSPDFGMVDAPPAHVNCRCTTISDILS